MASVDDRLFVLRSPSQQVIQVYDLQTFTLQSESFSVPGLSDKRQCNGLTACDVNKRLYVSDFSNAAVYQVRLTDGEKHKWSVGKGPCGLSINSACNLLVACYVDYKIQEYTKERSLVREIRIQCNDSRSLLHPHHVIQMTDGHFAISCRDEDEDNVINDVVEADVEGRLITSYRSQLQSTTRSDFWWPRHLAVDKNNKFILVADCNNNRIVVLSRTLDSAGEFDVRLLDGGLKFPSCLHFDQSQGRLFVGETSGRGKNNGQHRVLVFDNVV